MHGVGVIGLFSDIVLEMSITVATNGHISIISLFNIEAGGFKLLFRDHHDVRGVFEAGLRATQ